MKKNFKDLRSEMSPERRAQSKERAQKPIDELEQDRKDAAALLAGVLEGYRDILAGRVTRYNGDLRAILDEARRRTDPDQK